MMEYAHWAERARLLSLAERHFAPWYKNLAALPTMVGLMGLAQSTAYILLDGSLLSALASSTMRYQ
jgi:hypothetical protein